MSARAPHILRQRHQRRRIRQLAKLRRVMDVLGAPDGGATDSVYFISSLRTVTYFQALNEDDPPHA